MCSALGQDQLLHEAQSAGAAGFVIKPFQAHDLISAVERATAGRGGRAAVAEA